MIYNLLKKIGIYKKKYRVETFYYTSESKLKWLDKLSIEAYRISEVEKDIKTKIKLKDPQNKIDIHYMISL